MKNTGFIAEHRSTDYVFGTASKIIHEDRNTTGDWEQFLPTAERQSGRFFDTMSCVTFSALNSLETQMRWMIANKLIPVGSLRWLSDNGYMDDNGYPNFSDRFTAKMSGTTAQGNSMQAVWDSIRKDGVAPDSKWPNSLDAFNRDVYFSEPSDEVKLIARQFLQHFKAEYEKVAPNQMAKALKHAPLHIATAVCSGWGSDSVVKTCNEPAAHATEIYAIRVSGYMDFDTYDPFKKTLAKDYVIPFIYKGVLTPLLKDDGTPKPDDRFIFDRDLVAGETSLDVKYLQDRLAVIDPATGFYGPMTVAAVKRYMVYNNIGSWYEKYVWPAGRRVGSKIRAKLNSVI